MQWIPFSSTYFYYFEDKNLQNVTTIEYSSTRYIFISGIADRLVFELCGLYNNTYRGYFVVQNISTMFKIRR